MNGVVLVFVASTLLVWALLPPAAHHERERLERLVTPGLATPAGTARSRRLSRPLVQRLIASGPIRWLAGGPESTRRHRTTSLLMRAGLQAPGDLEWFLLTTMALGLLGGGLGALVSGLGGFCTGFLAGVASSWWRLHGKGLMRKRAIARSLPDVLDLWIACLEAGQGFEAAVHRFVSRASHLAPELAVDLHAWQQATSLGADRRSALLARARGTDSPDWEAVVQAWIQAEETGAGLARTLRGQRDRIRESRRQRAKERAVQAPVKLLFPLVFCIFPALFVVTLGPAVMRLWALFSRNPVH